MKRSFLILVSSILLIASFMVGCGDDDNMMDPEMGTLTLSITDLQDLGAGFAFEGWIIVSGIPISTGTFTVDGSGNLSNTTFQVLKSDLDAATKFILTIEPSPDFDPSPSSTHYLAGTFTDVNSTDSDSAGPTAGPVVPTPAFPGQDYITPPISLIGFTAVISIEPDPDNNSDPFTLKPLVDMNIEDLGAGVLQGMANDATSFPTGTATR